MIVASDVVRRAQARIGLTVGGKWHLDRVLGIGGMATVYAATHRNQNRVAIKMLHPEQSVNEVIRVRFLREGYVGNTVEHPGAVRVHDDGVTDDGAAFLVMELLDGESLEDRRDRHGGHLPVSEVLLLADQLLDVLVAAHAKNIVHRDIKPENVFLTHQGQVKVLDFGIARLAEPIGSSGGTSVGTFMGTPSFMPPEQARARWSEVDGRSDLWAVGASMFTLLSGRAVHEAETVQEQLILAASSPAPPVSLVAPDVPHNVAAIIDRALAYDKANRWTDARTMQQAVRQAMQNVGAPETLSVPVPAMGRIPSASQVSEVDATLAAAEAFPGVSARPVTSVSGVTGPPGELALATRPRSRMFVIGVSLSAAVVVAGMVSLLFGLGRTRVKQEGQPTPSVNAGQLTSSPEVSPSAHPFPVSPDAPSASGEVAASPAQNKASSGADAGTKKSRAPKAIRTSEKPASNDSNPFDRRF
jgi:serine/threonine-protein kinase